MRPVCLGLGIALGCAGAASAQDAAAGRALAERWCTDCHVIGEGPGPDAGPAFSALSPVAGWSADALRAWIMDPHGAMPKLDLTDQEIRDLVAYIRGLSG